MAWPILGTVVSLAAGYAYDKWTEKKKREELARNLKGYGAISGLNPAVATYAKVLMLYLREDLGYPAVIIEGKRSKQRQARLYAQGRTTPGQPVTWTRDSKHISGRAFDLGFAGYRIEDVPSSWFEDAGEVWEDLGGVWGGRWDIADLGHFEA